MTYLHPLTTWKPAIIKDLPATGNGEPAAWREVSRDGVAMFEVVYRDPVGNAYRALFKTSITFGFAVRKMVDNSGNEERFTIKALNEAVITHKQSVYITHADGFDAWKQRMESHRSACGVQPPDFCD